MNKAYLYDSYSKTVQNKIARLIQSIIKGRDDVLISPMAKEHGADFLLSEFNKVFDANSSLMNSTLIDLENSNKSKFGPRSIAIPWSKRKNTLYDSFGIESSDRSFELMPLKGGEGRLRPLSVDNALKLLKNSTTSGLPFYVRKSEVKAEVAKNLMTYLKRQDPCLLFTRTQEQGKTRNVWGYPIADTLNEMRFYSPLLLHQLRKTYRAALGKPIEISTAVTALILNAVNKNHVLISVDFSSYDNSVKSALQNVAFDYIKSCFQSIYHKEIDYISYRFKSISIITPDGILKGDHGVPSGSTFTNEVDSIVQAAIALSNPFISETDFQVQGDDGVYAIPRDSLTELYKSFESSGLMLNEAKSYLSSDYCIFLQCLYHKDYLNNQFIGGIYPVYRALNRILFQERWSTFEDNDLSGKDYYSIRTICIVENCKYHPLFRELVKFVLKYDKYSLEYSEQGLVKYVQMMTEVQGAGEVLIHQPGDDYIGINGFETVKLIRELG